MTNFKFKCVNRDEENKEAQFLFICEKCNIPVMQYLNRNSCVFLCPCCGVINECFVNSEENLVRIKNELIEDIYKAIKEGRISKNAL